MRDLFDNVRKVLPRVVKFRGVELDIQPMTLKTLQFVLCKVYHVNQFVLSGKTGKHGRTQRVLVPLGESDEEEP